MVSILPVSIIPFALRKIDGNRHRLIGEAYLHGNLHGEATKLERWNLEEYNFRMAIYTRIRLDLNWQTGEILRAAQILTQ